MPGGWTQPDIGNFQRGQQAAQATQMNKMNMEIKQGQMDQQKAELQKAKDISAAMFVKNAYEKLETVKDYTDAREYVIKAFNPSQELADLMPDLKTDSDVKEWQRGMGTKIEGLRSAQRTPKQHEKRALLDEKRTREDDLLADKTKREDKLLEEERAREDKLLEGKLAREKKEETSKNKEKVKIYKRLENGEIDTKEIVIDKDKAFEPSRDDGTHGYSLTKPSMKKEPKTTMDTIIAKSLGISKEQFESGTYGEEDARKILKIKKELKNSFIQELLIGAGALGGGGNGDLSADEKEELEQLRRKKEGSK